MFKVIFSKSYQRRAIKFFKVHTELISQYEKVVKILEKNPFHPSLRLHKLQPPMQAFHSISINMKYRISLELILNDKEIILINVGTHDQVYR